jgi:hypothetical protein
MELTRKIGLYVILGYLLLVFSLMLCDYKLWEPQLVFVVKEIGKWVPAIPKFLLAYTKIITQAAGAIGVLFTFDAGYGSKHSIRTLTYFIVTSIFLFSIPQLIISKHFIPDVIAILKTTGIVGGLLQSW